MKIITVSSSHVHKYSALLSNFIDFKGVFFFKKK